MSAVNVTASVANTIDFVADWRAFSSAAVSCMDDPKKCYYAALAHGDPRVRSWLLMDPQHMAITVAAYLVLVGVLTLIMKFMSAPFKPKTFAVIHNLNLTLLSAVMAVEIIRQAVTHQYSLFGNGVDHSSSGDGMARVLWLFYVSKVLEFIDTFMMAIKQNFRQITFLHLYHHASIFIIWWVIVYYAPGGEAYFSAALNSFVHVVMYGYYLWSTLTGRPAGRPRWTDAAFYRPYITTLQMTQFTLMLIQATYDLFVPNPYPRFCVWILFLYMFTMLGLFANFFVQQYAKPAKNKELSKES